jgi:two-component system phosphate regulon response regulator PhoB
MPTALVVDDDPDIRGVVEYMLEQAGFQVYVESEGQAGLERAKDLRPDVVLLDWMMPGMTGVEVCIALRTDTDMDSMAVILLTAKARESDVQLGFAAGADEYIVKPFSPRQMVAQVQAVLERPRAQLPTTVCQTEISEKRVH